MIKEFRGKYAFLSNFYECDIRYGSLRFKSVESAFQALKSKDYNVRKMFENLSPADSKKLGRKIELREDWSDIRIKVMLYLVRLKFKDKELRKKLLETGYEEIVEGNWWNDEYWGVNLKNNKGNNYLGRILMIVRKELRDEG